jgi:hypothetical protein
VLSVVGPKVHEMLNQEMSIERGSLSTIDLLFMLPRVAHRYLFDNVVICAFFVGFLSSLFWVQYVIKLFTAVIYEYL